MARLMVSNALPQGAPAVFLDTQFRMHPAIAAYPARAFYHGRLRNGVSAHDRPPPQGFDWPQTAAHGVRDLPHPSSQRHFSIQDVVPSLNPESR